MNELRLKIKLEGREAKARDTLGEVDGLTILGEDNGDVAIEFGNNRAGDRTSSG